MEEGFEKEVLKVEKMIRDGADKIAKENHRNHIKEEKKLFRKLHKR